MALLSLQGRRHKNKRFNLLCKLVSESLNQRSSSSRSLLTCSLCIASWRSKSASRTLRHLPSALKACPSGTEFLFAGRVRQRRTVWDVSPPLGEGPRGNGVKKRRSNSGQNPPPFDAHLSSRARLSSAHRSASCLQVTEMNMPLKKYFALRGWDDFFVFVYIASLSFVCFVCLVSWLVVSCCRGGMNETRKQQRNGHQRHQCRCYFQIIRHPQERGAHLVLRISDISDSRALNGRT